ncbi:MAG: WD40/YVTN/BNR-like repeat-containing protein [Flavobacteriaceae bacterium]
MFFKPCISVLFALFFLQVSAQSLDFSKLQNLNIRNVGPANMSGRITAIDVVEKNTKVMYVGAASGGVWKSENGGSAWVPIFDEQPTQNIGALAIDQNNPEIIWVGTGEGNPRNSMNLGAGLFKSTDAGKTWTHMGLTDTKTIHRIHVDPRDGNTVFVGAMGDPFTPNEHRGLYKTIDGGSTWQKILYTNNQSGIADMVVDKSNPDKIFVALYEHRRTPYYFTSGGSGSGLYLTHDAGKTWLKLGEKEGLPAGELGRIGIAIAPSDANRVYAKIEAVENKLYRSDDGGKNWTVINEDPKFTNNRPFYFQDIAVDSEDPDRLYNIYQPLSVSYDGGKTFDPTPMIPADETKGIHADFHAFWVNPADARHFIIGGDGGLGITYDHGKSWYFPETIPVAQFYHINVDHDKPYNVYGGMQDNGNWSGPGYTWKRGGIRTLYWQYLVGGDGFFISPDLDDSRFGYGTSQNGYLYRYDKLTGYYVSIKPPAPDARTRLRFNWNAGFARDLHHSSTAYYGSQFVHKTTDKGATWSIISPDLTTDNPEHQKPDYGGLTLDVSGAEIYNSILTIAPSKTDQNVIWVGTDDGQIQLSRDGGATWQNVTKNINGLPDRSWIAQIQSSPKNASSAWVVANNYRKGDYAPYLFKTEDFGQTWQRIIDETKVKGYALSVIQDPEEPNLVFLGTEHGLWVSIDKGNTWSPLKNGFPSVSTMDLTIQEPESALIIGTFGRAIWVLDDLLSLREIAANRLKGAITALPVNDAVQVKGLFINPPGNIWTGFHTTFEGENRVFQKTRIPYYLAELKDSTATVTATIYNEKKERINTIAGDSLVVGLNYLTWHLDEKSASLPGASQKIAVLPGTYTVAIDYAGAIDSTSVKVIPDPRFDLTPEVEEDLYAFRKKLDGQVVALSQPLTAIDKHLTVLKELTALAGNADPNPTKKAMKVIKDMEARLNALRAKGQTPKPKRQVGAWMSFETTPFSMLTDLLLVADARTTLISDQHREIFEELKRVIGKYSNEVDTFLTKDWMVFKKEIQKSDLQWSDEWD